MEYLVTMTTVVPDGTPADAVDAVRTREAARSVQLAAEGALLRLWRPPLAPGEWRTLGLFVARDGDALEAALASMPLRVWRTDDVTALFSHRNDPERADAATGTSEFLTTFTVSVPDGTAQDVADREVELEASRARQLADAKRLQRLWQFTTPTGGRRVLGLWHATDSAEMGAILASLPLSPWMSVDTTPLAPHPNDPAVAAVGTHVP